MSITVTNNSSSSDYYDLLVRVQALEEQMLLTYNTSSFIPATAIALGRVTNEELDTLRDIKTTETVQHQLDTLSNAIAANPTFNNNSTVSQAEYLTLDGIDTTKTIQAQFDGVQTQLTVLNSQDTSLQNQINALSSPSSSVSVPIGTILLWTSNTPPSGFLFCQGQRVRTSTYPLLYGVIGKIYTPPNLGWSNSIDIDNGTEFYLPDLRGMFVRGVGTNQSSSLVASGLTLGTFQEHAIADHRHRYARPRVDKDLVYGVGPNMNTTDFWDNSVHEYTNNDETTPYLTRDTYHTNGLMLDSTETHPSNISLHYIIKF
jgi:microcystin-dependent protein